MANGDPFILEELEGDDLIVLELFDTEMPERGVSQSVEQRVQVTRYPGLQAPTRHVMGVTDDDVTLKGAWHDGLIFERPGAVRSAAELERAAQLLVRRRRRCRLAWGTRLVLEGWVQRWQVEHRDAGFLRWTMTFSVDRSQPGEVEPYQRQELPDVDQAAEELDRQRVTLAEVVGQGLSVGRMALRRAPDLIEYVELRSGG